MKKSTKKSPGKRDYLFGVAAAAYQIEGGAGYRGRNIWDDFCDLPGRIHNGDKALTACDHYSRWEEDVALIRDLGADAYRFSISWARLLPEGTGKASQQGIDFYSRLIDKLLESGIQPWITFYHWDLPTALQRKGGLASKDMVGWFSEYMALCLKSYNDRVNNWMVVNEPSVIADLGFVRGIFAPGVKDPAQGAHVVHNLNHMIARGCEMIKSSHGKNRAGSTFTYTRWHPLTKSAADARAAANADALWNRAWLDPLTGKGYPEELRAWMEPVLGSEAFLSPPKAALDFIGLQHYSPSFAKAAPINHLQFADASMKEVRKHHGIRDFTSFGWAIHEKTFYETLKTVHARYNMPIIVTENGACFDDKATMDAKGRFSCKDPERINFLKRYLGAFEKAKKEGVPLEGYFYWSFLDNFEWASGYSKRFGLIYVDYARDCLRVPKSSYHWLRKKLTGKK
jgi:beta-glucosidase